jgi:uncharacterized protein YndB with AHSA1/START domain
MLLFYQLYFFIYSHIMDDHKSTKPKILFYYVFRDHIERVWECLKSPEITAKSLKPKVDTLTILKGSDFSEVGTVFQFWWKDEMFSEFEVKEVINTKNYKMIREYTTKLEPLSFKYTFTSHLYWNTHDHTTLFKSELIFDDLEALKVIDLKFTKQEKIDFCNGFENHLATRLDDLFQFESILINIDIEALWQVITDWNIFQKHVPFIGEEIKHEGNPLQIGSKIHIKNNSINSEFSLNVKKVLNEAEKKEYVLELTESTQPQCPKQNLILSLLTIKKFLTSLTFKHEFKENTKYNLIHSVSEEKKNILLELKKKLEKKI